MNLTTMTTRTSAIALPLLALACTLSTPESGAQSAPRAAAPSAAVTAAAPARLSANAATRRTPLVEMVEKVAPSVVNISTEQRVENPFRSNSFFGFFGDPFSGNGGENENVQNSLGSGVIVDAQGYILTNNHVIAGASKIQVTLLDRRSFTAEVVGADAASDLALLKIENGRGSFPAVRIGGSSDLMIGETVIAIGNPYGLSHTVSSGILSAIGRTVNTASKRYSDYLQIDAPINPGNSGGPLVNIMGELIGVNTAILQQGQSIGFAIPVDRAKKIMGDLRASGAVRAVWLGFQVSEPDPRKNRGVLPDGLIVNRVYTGSAADTAGIRPGDTLRKFGGRPIASQADVDTAIATVSIGETVPVEISRHGKIETRTIRITASPKEVSDALLYDLLGLKVTDGEGAAVIAAVGRDTPAAEIGLNRGDFILKINGQPTANAAALKRSVAAALGQEAVSVVVQRGRGYYRITLPMGI